MLAAWYGHIEITRLLLAHHADVDAVNCDGNCALNCAAYHGFIEVRARGHTHRAATRPARPRGGRVRARVASRAPPRSAAAVRRRARRGALRCEPLSAPQVASLLVEA